MNLRLGYPNARSAAYSVKQELEKQGWNKITARPWNMYDPDHTFWWLVPSAEWPAYKHGKLFFSPDRAPDGCLFCGLHVEKGLDQRVAPAYESAAGKRLIIKDDWLWHEFVKDINSKKISHALEHASQKIKSPILIRIEAGIVQDPGSFDPQAPRPKWDTVIFETSANSLKAVNIETPAYLLNEVGKSEDLRGLAKSIPEIQMAGWIWIDFFMGSIFERISPALDQDTWGAADLWRKALSNWEPWFR